MLSETRGFAVELPLVGQLVEGFLRAQLGDHLAHTRIVFAAAERALFGAVRECVEGGFVGYLPVGVLTIPHGLEVDLPRLQMVGGSLLHTHRSSMPCDWRGVFWRVYVSMTAPGLVVAKCF